MLKWDILQFLAFDDLLDTFGLYYFFKGWEGVLRINKAMMIEKMRLFHFFTLWPLMAFISLLGFSTFFRLRESFLSIDEAAMIDKMRLFLFFKTWPLMAFDGLHWPFGICYSFQAKGRLQGCKLSNNYWYHETLALFYFVAFDGLCSLHKPFGLYSFFRLKEGFLSIN